MSHDLSLRIDGHTDKNDQGRAAQSLQSLYIKELLGMDRQNRHNANGNGTNDDQPIQSFLQEFGCRSARSHALNGSTTASEILGHVTHRQNNRCIEESEEEDEEKVNRRMLPMIIGESIGELRHHETPGVLCPRLGVEFVDFHTQSWNLLEQVIQRFARISARA